MTDRITRDPSAAAAAEYDVIVVGGGIYGVAVAFEAARRGLRPLLLERGDFGGETSWNSLRILHGGLRYLQTLDLVRFRESVGERHWLMAHFPDLVAPLACLMPLYGEGLRRPLPFRVAFALDRVLARRRNDGLAPQQRLAAGRVIGAAETRRLFPGAAARGGLQGGAFWHDAVMTNAPRLLIEWLCWACRAGATALNYVEARSLITHGDSVIGVTAFDDVGGREVEFRARLVVNCAGARTGGLLGAFDPGMTEAARARLFRPSLAFNLLIDRPPPADLGLAVSPPGRGGRSYFLVPWCGRIFAGTFYAARTDAAGPARAEPEEIAAFLADLDAALPGLELGPEAVLRVYAGLLPAAAAGSLAQARRPIVHDHGVAGGPAGLISVSGVKYTTARLVAEQAIGRAFTRLGRAVPAPRAVDRPPPLDCPDAATFLRLADTDAGAAAALLRRVVDQEAVVRLDDLLLRRTDWGTDPAAQERVGAVVGELIGLGGDASLGRPDPS